VYIGTVIDMPAALEAMFHLPKGVFPVVLLCLGYPKTRRQPRKKLCVNSVVHLELYREMEDRELLRAFNEKYEGERVAVAEDRLETILNVCRAVHGEGFAMKCAARIKADGYINRAQHYFGLHYRADLMPKGNDKYLKIMEESGFNCFRKYRPYSEAVKKQPKRAT
jgi:FMN reductase [NAD(P)H]